MRDGTLASLLILKGIYMFNMKCMTFVIYFVDALYQDKKVSFYYWLAKHFYHAWIFIVLHKEYLISESFHI